MLARNFLSAAELGIKDSDYEALIKVLGALERGEIPWHEWVPMMYEDSYGFNMAGWPRKHYGEKPDEQPHCGTVGCIGYWAVQMGASDDLHCRISNQELWQLFYPQWGKKRTKYYRDITPEQGAAALRNYLTLGKAMWGDVLA